MLSQLRHKYNSIPQHIKHLVLKALVLLCVWKLLYWLVFVPTGIPDHQLKILIGNGAAWMLSLFYDSTGTIDKGYTVVILVEGKRTLGIASACTGLELMALYIGVLLCLPARKGRLIAFIAGGLIGICILNMIRCALLVWIHSTHYELYDIAHKWVFQLGVYLAVFYGWILYLKGYGKKTA